MCVLLKTTILVLLISTSHFSQDPMPVLKATWQHTTQQALKSENGPTGPAREVTADNKYFQRKAREGQPNLTVDPNETTVDARREAMDKAVQESRTRKADDVRGYSYVANVRNDTGKTAEVIFWEFRFTEIARPTNIVRRQFLCGVKIKNGEKKDLSVFSILGPTDAITMESLAKSSEKLFNEEVYVNRIELADGSILQRPDWKYDQAAVKRATSTPWNGEICRAL